MLWLYFRKVRCTVTDAHNTVRKREATGSKESRHTHLVWVKLAYNKVGFFVLLFQSLSRVWFFWDPWTVACQAPLSMGFSRQEYWSGLPFLLQETFLTQGPNPHILRWRWAPRAAVCCAVGFIQTRQMWLLPLFVAWKCSLRRGKALVAFCVMPTDNAHSPYFIALSTSHVCLQRLLENVQYCS